MEIQAALDVADETDSFLQITDVIFDLEAEQGYQQLNEAEQTVFLIDHLLREMDNGGFDQFMHHEAGARAQDTVLALERIRAKESHAILDALIDLFPNRTVPIDDDERIAVFDQLERERTDDITQLDEQFHQTGENLVDLTLKYVTKHIKEFR